LIGAVVLALAGAVAGAVVVIGGDGESQRPSGRYAGVTELSPRMVPSSVEQARCSELLRHSVSRRQCAHLVRLFAEGGERARDLARRMIMGPGAVRIAKLERVVSR
jgi:hypothetical protein